MWWVCGLPKLAAFGLVNFDWFSNSKSGLDLIFEKTRDICHKYKVENRRSSNNN